MITLIWCAYINVKVSDGSVCVEAPGGFPFYVVDKDLGDKGIYIQAPTYIHYCGIYA